MALIIALLLVVFITTTHFSKRDPVKAILIIISSQFILPFIEIKLSSPNISGFILNVFLVYVLLIQTITKRNFNRLLKNPVVIYLFLAHVYLIIIAIVKNVYWLNYINEFRRYLNGIIVLIVILMSNNLTINTESKKIIKIIYILFLGEFFIAALSYIGPHQINSFFNVSDLIGNKVALKANLISGTLLKPNNFANTMAFLFFALIYLTYIKNNKVINNTRLSTLLIISSMSVLLSGIRTALISLAIGVVIFFFKFKKRYGLIVVASAFIIFGSFNLINYSTDFNQATKTATNPFQRMEGITVIFNGFQYISENKASNLWLTISVLNYFPNNIIFGGNRFYKQGYGLVRSDNNNSTDATLALLLTEHGLLGFFIFMFPFFYILRKLRKQSKDEFYFNLLFFSVLLLQTVSDLGLFQQVPSTLYFLISGLQINKINNSTT